MPFTTTLDLSGAAAGDVVTIMVRGGTGIETDPGDFGAIRRLMTDRPMRYAISSSDDRRLAAALMEQSSVSSVSLRARGGFDVQVTDLGGFAAVLPGLARSLSVTLFELSPSDESLESVFAYLIDRTGTTR